MNMKPRKTFGKKLFTGIPLLAALCLLWPQKVFAGNVSINVCGTGTNCNNFVNTYINPAIAVLTVIVGVAAVASIIIAGIQYSASADDPSAVTKAKQRIFNTVLGLVFYIFLFALINYLTPGGL